MSRSKRRVLAHVRKGVDRRDRVGRLAAGGAAIAVLVGAVGLLAATAGASIAGYVSESGVPGAPHAQLYQASVITVAAALGLLARSLWPSAGARYAPLALAAAAPLAALSGIVTCSARCPLPPYAVPTAGDLAHAGAATTALGLSALAMVALASGASDLAVRRVSRVGAVVAVPLLVASGVAILAVGRHEITGALERLTLVAALVWLLSVAVVRLGAGGWLRSRAPAAPAPSRTWSRPARR